MTIYAKQVPPEYQESPLLLTPHDWPENVFVFGNPHFHEHADKLNDLREAIERAGDEWDELQVGASTYDSWEEVLADHLAPWESRGEYTREERKHWADICIRYYEAKSYEENGVLCDALELISGEEWEEKTIRGCCQGDWQEIIYPAIYGADWLECFETEYFNTGSEWIIHNEDDTPKGPEDISGYSVYCYGWNRDKIRLEIAEAVGCTPAEVVLYAFIDWVKSPAYMEVGA